MFRDALFRPAMPTRVLMTNTADIATDWSQDNTWIAFTRPGPATGLDVWVLQLGGEMRASPFVQTSATEDNGAFSPAGGWLAYQSNVSGRDEIYLRPFPAIPGGELTVQISRDGGTQPRWNGDGKELFFLAADGGVMAAVIGDSTGTKAGDPQRLLPAMMTLVIRHAYTVTKDGQRFLIPVVDQSNPPVIEAVANWPATVQ
jgi:serine/threonine-protein kinase